MNSTFLPSIDDDLRALAPPEDGDPRAASVAAREQERAERGMQQGADDTAESRDVTSRYLHEAGWEPDLAASVARQYWAAPYDADYLVVTFPSTAAFKALDVVALSSKNVLSFEELKADDADADPKSVLEIVQPIALKERTWLTSVSIPDATASGVLYLHGFYATKGQPGDDAITYKAVRRQVFAPGADLPQVENPHNDGDVAQVAHPAIAPHRIPAGLAGAAIAASAARPVGAGASLPYQRLFLSLTPSPYGVYPWFSFVELNVDLAQGATPDKYDYIALASHYPENAEDYVTFQYVSDLDQGSYWTATQCDKWINWNLCVADLDKLETMYLFYGGWVNGAWTIIGNPVSYTTQKHWMTESLPDIGQKRLAEIVLPGAHDAGTYDLVAKGFSLNAQAQNVDFDGQLALGTRYFDCRLEYFPKSHPQQPFFFYHGVAESYTEITDLLDALRRFFVNENSKDIVILDFCRPSGFDAAGYDRLFAHFTNDPLFSNAMMTPEEAAQLTINELVARGRRLFLLCENNPARVKFNLGRSINLDSQWANVSKLSLLKAWLDNQIAGRPTNGDLWSLQAILTPVALNSLSEYAVELFPVLRGWVVDQWWDEANVVMSDFTAGTDLVHAAKACNERRNDTAKGNLLWYKSPGGQAGPPPTGVLVGEGAWTNFKSVRGASDGWIYAVDWEGNLQRYHDLHWLNGDGKMTNPRQTMQTTSPTDWLDYRDFFASSVDANERYVYAITGNYMSAGTGKLWRWRDTGGATLGEGQLIDAGWESYRIAFASSHGVIYAIDANDVMWRWQDTGGGSLGQGTRIAAGWEQWKTAFASSGGLIYGVDWSGNMWQWQDPGNGPLPNGQELSAGWGHFRMMFATSNGRFYTIQE